MSVPSGSPTDHSLPDALDLASALEAAQALADQVELSKLLKSLIRIMIENAGAQEGYVLELQENRWIIVAAGSADGDEEQPDSLDPVRVGLSMAIVRQVADNHQPVLLCQGMADDDIGQDTRQLIGAGGSLLCLPMILHHQLVGVVYMRNRLTVDACAPGRLQLLNLLATQAAICLQNARLLDGLEQVEQAARSHQQRFRHLFENAPLCIFEVDLAATPASILAANYRAEAVYGWTAEEFTTMPAETLVPPSAGPEIRRMLERVRSGETVTFEAPNRRRDGTIFPARIIATPEMGPHTDHMIVAVEDITAEKERHTEAEAIDEERRRIAQEIHDGVAQDMAAVRMRASLWPDLVETDPTQLKKELDNLQVILDDGIQHMRQVIYALRPVALDEVGLFPALRQLAADFENQYRVHVDLQILGSEPRLPEDLELPLFRILQEALNNVGKHARASVVRLALDLSGETAVTLTVRDNGLGFDPASLEGLTRAGHLGLKQMRERAEKAGGTLAIHSQPGQGTELHVVLPLEP